MLSDVDGQMSEAFPVIDRQWGAVAHFREAILEGCQKALASTQTDPVRNHSKMTDTHFFSFDLLTQDFVKWSKLYQFSINYSNLKCALNGK